MLNLRWLALVPLLGLVACTNLEQRSEDLERKPLTAIESPINITRKWMTDTGTGTDDKDLKLLLVRDGHTLYTVDACGKVIAINAADGKILWETYLKMPVSAGPAVGEGKLVVGTSDGRVAAVDLKNHNIAWISHSTSEILATPKISADKVYIHTMDGGLSALSLIDGRQLWRFTHNLPPLMLRRSSTPAVKNDLVIAGFANGKLLAMQQSDGSVVWTQDISHPKGSTDLQRMVDISADPLVYGDRVYAASYQGNTDAVNITNGQLLWERNISSYSGLTADKDNVYIAATNGEVVALEAQNGATYWLQTELQGRKLSKPALYEKYLVVADDDGSIHWLEKNTGKMLGRYELNKDGIEATPVIENNIVYILGRDGVVIALEVC